MLRALTLILTILTGFSGLVYEVTWQKGLAILLGSHSEATAAVLAIFLGGLSLGYSIFGRISNRVTQRAGRGAPRRLLLLYGAVEASIGAWALLWPWLFQAARALSITLPFDSEALRFGFDLLLTALLIGPPTVLMGGTIPLLTQALARDLDDATRFHARVYGYNTLGAFAGALAGGFFLIPWLGIPGALGAMGAVNLAVGAIFASLFWTASDASEPAPASATSAQPCTFPLFATVALLLGFAMMALQTVLIRVGGLALGASHFAFAMLVATFVLCIAIGSLAVSTRQRIPVWVVAACPIALGMLLALLYPWIEYAPYAVHVVRSLFQSIDQAFYPYFSAVSLGILLVFALPLGLSGASLPLLFHALRNEMGELGGVAGRIYGWNTVGSLLGALLGGYILLHWLDLHHIYRIAVIAVLVAGGLLAVRIAGSPRVATAALVALAIGALALLPAWSPRQMTAGYFRQRRASEATWRGPAALLASRDQTLGSQSGPVGLLFFDDDPIATVSVVNYHVGGKQTLAIMTNGKNDSSLLVDYPTMALAGLLPCLMVERCQKAFVIGLGAGVTAGELGSLDEIERVLVAEISPGVIEAAPLFDAGNRGTSKNPKIEIVRSDAYRALLHGDELWNVIASEPSNPWVAGVEMLYSKEFLEAARERLAPGGVYAQWIHSYEMDDATLELVLRTYASVFEQVGVWYTFGEDLLLLGFEDASASPDLDRIAERFQHADLSAGLQRARISTLEELLAHELVPVGYVTRSALPGEEHTLLHPRLSHQAAHAFFTAAHASLPFLPDPPGGDVLPALIQQLRARRGPDDDATRTRIVEHVCTSRPKECSVLVARWMHDDPDSAALWETLAKSRAQPTDSAHLDPRTLDLLAKLFGDGRERISPEGATVLTNLYFRYFDRAEPFRVETLRSIWRFCQEPTCMRMRLDGERRLRGHSKN